MNETIKSMVPESERLAQLAEECSELGKAALKLRRAMDTVNPTPVSAEEARAALVEEIADVMLNIETVAYPEYWAKVQEIMSAKAARWVERITHGREAE